MPRPSVITTTSRAWATACSTSTWGPWHWPSPPRPARPSSGRSTAFCRRPTPPVSPLPGCITAAWTGPPTCSSLIPRHARSACHEIPCPPFPLRHAAGTGSAGREAGKRLHRNRSDKLGAEHADCGAHPGDGEQPGSPRLDYNVVNQLRASLANTERLLAEARGLAYEVQRLDQEFSRLYPNDYTGDVSSQRLAQEAHERWQQGLNGLHTALRVQAQVTQNLAEDEHALAALVQQSQSAGGALQAAQATNQLLALQAKQSIQAQQLQITQNRAIALELARQAAAAEEARERRRRFMGSGRSPHENPGTATAARAGRLRAGRRWRRATARRFD
ncbi:hypothetical protein G6F24_012916 [Rhizopus arrhizus]|nr:hypothetical protein G6F24_012916 [Rhizopus arrhizus]